MFSVCLLIANLFSRKMVTTVVTGLCLLSVCLGVGGVCVGFCNLTGTPPHLRQVIANCLFSIISSRPLTFCAFKKALEWFEEMITITLLLPNFPILDVSVLY